MERYSEYKDSGVQWLGEIPSHWEVVPLKYCININNGRDYKEYESSEGIPVIGTGGQFAYSSVEMYSGEVVFFGRKGTVDKPFYYKGGFWAVDTVFYAIPKNNMVCKYLYYVGTTIPFGLYSTSTAIPSMTQTDLMNNSITLPPRAEQNAMVEYLDSVTSQIDTAIEQQQKMIDLLNERKQIIINNAVTKGLDPNVKMKDSGVDWIGEIPEGWEVRKLKHFVYITDGTHDTPRYVDPSNNTYPLVTSRCIVNGVIDLSLANHISEQDYREIATRSYVRKFDVIMPMIGTVGNPAVVDFDDCVAIKNVALFRTNGDIYKAKFLKFLLDSSIVKEQFSMYNKGGVQNFVSQDILKNLTMIVPINVSEIVDFIENEIDKLIQPISILTNQIALLQERKQIIINDVVTGKVKVS